MKSIAELEAEIRQEIPVHATETPISGLADWSEAEIEDHRQKERRDAVRMVIHKRKSAAAAEELYARLEQQSAAPRTFSEVVVHAMDSLCNRHRR